MKRSAAMTAAGVAGGVVVVAVIAAAIGGIALAVRSISRPREGKTPYDLTDLRRVDPDLIICEELRAFPTGLQTSRGIALAGDGRIAVCGDSAVRFFDANGTRTGEVKTAEPAGAVAIDADGTLYAAMKDHVEVHAPDGRRKAVWAAAVQRSLLTAIALAGGDVYVADAGGRAVLRCDKTGKLLLRIGQKDPNRNIPGLIVPSPYLDVAAASDGLLRVANPGRHRVEAYTPQGHLEFHWGRATTAVDGFCGCCNPCNFAVVPSAKGFGEFAGYVTTEKGLTRVKLFDADGEFAGVVAGPASFARHDGLLTGRPTDAGCLALDVAADAAGRIFVLDPVVNEVRVFQRIADKAPGRGRK